MTLPEALVNSIKELVRAHAEYTKQVEELTTLGMSIRGDLDRLVPRENIKLADINLSDKRPVALPKAIIPREAESGAA